MRVSVCIPAYNAASFVAQAIESVLAQTYRDVEVIVVNDGSTDDTRLILSAFEGRILIIDQNNQGQCAAANRAFEAATGELIKFFDADDVLSPTMIELQVAKLGRRDNAIALGEWTRFYGKEPANEGFARLPMYRDATPTDWLIAEWERAQPMMQCALWLIPRGIIERAGLWDERLTLINDFEYFTRVLLKADQILFAPGARLYYRSGIAGSLSGLKTRKAVESQFLSTMLGTGHLLDAEDSARARRACANMLQSFEYEHYPHHRDLRAMVRARVAELGGADIAPNGPPGFQRLRPWIGWKAARHAQRAAERMGLNKASIRTRHTTHTG